MAAIKALGENPRAPLLIGLTMEPVSEANGSGHRRWELTFWL
jgi:hypothetical protein